MSTGNLESLRSRNRRAVLSAVQAMPGSSRADIARRTGLSTSTVSTLVADLVSTEVIIELAGGPAVRGNSGRPSVSLAVNPRAGSVLGIHLGHAGTRVVLTTLDGSLYADRAEHFNVDRQPVRSLEQVAATALDLIREQQLAPGNVVGVGVAVSAPVLDARALASPPMLLDWGGIDIAAQLRPQLELPVYLGNDATLGALAEWRLGAGAGHQSLIYVMLSEGVGAGLIIDGRIYSGVTGAAGELGHIRVTSADQICRCGNRGCLETVVGARALVNALAHSKGPRCTLEDLLSLVADGDVGARRLLSDAGRVVGDALANICSVLDPGLVVLGGDLTDGADAAQLLVSSARDSLDLALPPVSNHAVQVRAAQLGARSEALGAALLAAENSEARVANPGEHR